MVRLGVVLVLTLAAAIVLVVRSRRAGRLRAPSAAVADAGALALREALARSGDAHAASLTVAQLSSPICAPCRQAARVWSRAASDRGPSLRHVELSLEAHPHLARELAVLSTPTTFLLDRNGSILGRVSGAPSRQQAEAAIDSALSAPRGDRSEGVRA